ncbi:hypothetical protein ABZ612_20395 [Streptomyces avermitilis]|uniref:hypothetical protein n=1 Tax=Streptomyces avermitilis TaxID=33903 RepID=UPI0033F75551
MLRLHHLAADLLTPATPEQLAELDRLLRPASTSSLAVAVDAAEVHADTVAGRYTTEALGRYCRTGLPPILRRLLAVETELLTMRGKVAAHIAEYDQGHDPTGLELLEGLGRAGIDLGVDVQAAAVLEGEAHAGTFA